MLPVKAIVSTDFTVDPFFSVDDNGHIVGINEAAAIATGLNETELTSTLFIDLFTDRAKAGKMLHEVMEKGIVNNFSLTFSSENGHAAKPVILNAMMYVDKSIDSKRVFVFTHEFPALNNNNGEEFERIPEDEENAKSETRFRSTLDKMLEGVQIIGFDWRFIYVNDALAQQAKYTKEQLLGHTVMEMYPGFEHLAIYKEYKRCFEERVSIQTETEFTFDDGSAGWFELSIQPVDEGIFILSVDISTRKKLQEQQALLASIINSSDDAILSKNLSGIITSWNNGATKIFGYSPEEIIGKHISVLIPTGLQNEENEIMAGIKQDKGINHYETTRVRKDGTIIYVSLTISPLKNSRGNVVGASKICRNITERIKAEQDLLQSEAKFRKIYETKMVGILFWTTQGEILECNDRFLDIVGYSRQDLEEGKLQWKKMTPPEYGLLDEEALQQIALSGVSVPFEKEYFRKDGGRVPVLIGAASLDNNDLVGGVAFITDITDRKKAENEVLKLNHELSKSEKKFRGLIENSYDIVSISDGNFRPIYRSPSSVRITGWTNEDRADQGGADKTHPDDVAKLKGVMRSVLNNPGTPYLISFRTMHRDGYYVFLEGMITNMIQNEAINGIVSNFRDVTETRQAEEKIRESEKMYKTIASGIPGSVICLLDEDYRYFLIEGDLLGKLGYSKKQLLGKKAADVLPPEKYAEALPDFERVFRGEVFTYDKKRGDYHTLSRFVPLKNADNKVYAAMVVVIDITELKKAEQHILELNVGLEQKVAERTAQLEEVNKYLQSHMLRLKESEEKFSKIFDTSPVGIAIAVIETGIIRDANKSFLELTGFSYEEVIGRTSLDLNMIHEEDREKLKQEYIENGKIRDKEVSAFNRSGESFPVLLSMDHFLIGEVRYSITIAYDISKRKKAEEQLMAANKELEAFSYSVSHDLRAPLRAVNGYARIMEEDYSNILDDEGRRLLKVIKDSGNRMGLLIDDLLAFSRLGRKEIKRSAINMNELAKNVVAEINETTPHTANIRVEPLHPVMGDYSLLNHVMVNLILNGIKYSAKKEHPVVTISSKKEGREVIFSISDNGVGFDMKYVHKLFGVFQRLHSTEEFPGTGVGLAIVQRIINKHGGRVWAEAKINEGAVFSFAIPEQ